MWGPIYYVLDGLPYRHRFHKVMAQRALMRAVPSLRENGNDMKQTLVF